MSSSVRNHKNPRCEYVNIEDFKVPFPYKPYAIQEDFMSKILKALVNNENALLESPTGSGKTLSLLAPVLAYLQTLQEKPTVYFASRTHSQLKQAIEQLRLLTSLNATTLASRNHLCLNKDVKDLSGGLASIKCKVKTNYKSKDSCLYYEGFKRNQKNLKNLKLADIEDLTSYGQKSSVCPYFTSRLLTSQVDFVFLPYNYLFDNSKSDHFLVNVNIESGQLDVSKENEMPPMQNRQRRGAIIIFDEAHNMESVALNATSFEVSINDLDLMLGELRYCSGQSEEYDCAPNYFDSIVLLINKMQLFIKSIQFPKQDKFNSSKVIKDASCMYNLFEESGIDTSSAQIISKAIEILTNDSSKSKVHLDVLLTGIRIMFMSTNTNYFKVSIEKQTIRQFNKIAKDQTILRYYCLHSGIAMNLLNDLTDNQGNKLITSFILASGTLSPMSSFAFESGLVFDNILSNPHVIKPYQMCIRASGTGPLKTSLQSTYNKRDDPNYLKDLGYAIIQISEQVKGGVLVFFPAYALMEKCMMNWNVSSYTNNKTIYNTLSMNKSVFLESKNRDEFEKIINNFENATTQQTGAILFAVCRGKASEGIDFRNDKCRAVICIGFPFPNLGDAKVTLKKSFMDKLYHMPPRANGVISGSEWYKQQAIRAINQAIGRVIRHKDDYGCIILLDDRFVDQSYKKYLPTWISPYFIQNQHFDDTLNAIKSFFRNPKIKELKQTSLLNQSATIEVARPIKRERQITPNATGSHKKVKVDSRVEKKLEAKVFMDKLRNTLNKGQFAIFKQNLVKLNNDEMTSNLFAKEIVGFMKTSTNTHEEQSSILSRLASFLPSDKRHQYLSEANSYIRK
eukprot:NODE_13_length_42895_cov_0.518413.p4 type:complete len:850 gc:universal NODE_13_length_42895_cov_0.518413:39322-41871(+)